MNKAKGPILAIESAIGGGSISLLRNATEMGRWIGDAFGVSKAENLLTNIDRLLYESSIDKSELDLIAVSAGPGSFTGVRIGIATALGLKMGLGIKMASGSALKAIVYEHGREANDLFAAVPVGRDSVCVQRFSQADAVDEPRTLPEAAFAGLVDDHTEAVFLVHATLFGKLNQGPRIIDAGVNIAYSIGLICSINTDVVEEPLFIAKSF